MPAARDLPPRPGQRLGHRRPHARVVHHVRRRQPLLHLGDVFVDGRQPVIPLAALVEPVAARQIGGVGTGALLHPRPCGPSLAIGLERLPQRIAVARLLVDGIQHPATELGGEETAQPNLQIHVDRHPPGLRRSLCAGQRQLLLRRVCEIFQPLRHLDGRILAGARALQHLLRKVHDAREQLRVRRTDVAEGARRG